MEVSTKPIRKRTLARELALQYLFQWDLLGGRKLAPSEAPDAFCQIHSADADVNEFAQKIIAGVIDNRDPIDATILATAKNWALGRMLAVDRTILRIAVFELVYCPDTPARVAINEAIELAKKFSTERSSAFVNGILDRIAHATATTPATRPDSSSSTATSI